MDRLTAAEPVADNPNGHQRAADEHVVLYVVWPGLQALDVTGPHEVFDAANRVADGLGRGGRRYRQHIVGPSGTEITTESGLRLGCEPLTAAPETVDTLVLPGGDGVYEASTDPDLVAFTTGAGRRAGRIATVCTGTFLAAASGLIDGRQVATHWARAQRLQRDYPSLNVDAESLHHRDGPVWSSAGVTAGMDLALALVEHDHDAEVAQIAAR